MRDLDFFRLPEKFTSANLHYRYRKRSNIYMGAMKRSNKDRDGYFAWGVRPKSAVWRGTKQSTGQFPWKGLKKADLKKNAKGRVVSIKVDLTTRNFFWWSEL